MPLHILMSPIRERYVAAVRMLIMLELREGFWSVKTRRPLPLSVVAHLVGRTDHKTAHHAVATGRASHEATIAECREDYALRRQLVADRSAKIKRAWHRMRNGRASGSMHPRMILAAGCSVRLSMR